MLEFGFHDMTQMASCLLKLICQSNYVDADLCIYTFVHSTHVDCIMECYEKD